MRILAFFVLAIVASGCSKAGPTLAGGKPIDHWIQALNDPNPNVRKTAATKLGNVGPTDPAALPALQTALNDRDGTVRCEVILALVKFGPAAKEAVPALAEMRQRDVDAKVRDYAAKALAKLE
jgi:HEAT repeat protein